nr:AT-rich interactive domain-containing protein 1-like isoform X2 [Tanacetum cinerariifolium]
MLGDGKAIGLLKLYLCVREKGGYECVTRDESWDLVAKEIGCDLDACASLKVVYLKYLGLLEEYFSKIVKDKSSGGESIGLSSFDSSKFFSDAQMKNYQEFVDTVGLKDLQSCVGSIDRLDAKDDAVVESNVGITEEEIELSRKRKRERYLPLLDWVKRVAKDPCDLAIGSLPERSKWKGYGSEYVWKQVLSAREARVVKTSFDPKAKHAWQMLSLNGGTTKRMRGVICITEEEIELSRKRKRERYLPLLDWVKRVAKDPCDLAIGSLPERSKWKGYGSEYVWKQVLSAREARVVKTSFDPKAKHAWQGFFKHLNGSGSVCLLTSKEIQRDFSGATLAMPRCGIWRLHGKGNMSKWAQVKTV